MTTWFLIADGSRARIFSRGEKQNIALVEEFDHPEGRAHAGDLSEDQGRTRQTGSAAYAAERDERSARRDDEETRFAKRIAASLERGAMQNAYEELVIISSPHFLGEVRDKLHDKVKSRVVATLNKDLTELTEHELKKRDDVFNLVTSL